MLTKSRFIEQLMIREKLSKNDAKKIYKSAKTHKKCIRKCKKTIKIKHGNYVIVNATNNIEKKLKKFILKSNLKTLFKIFKL